MCHLEEKLNIYGTIQPIFIKFLQNDRIVSGHLTHVTDDPEDVVNGKICQNTLFVKRIFLKKNFTVKSLWR